MEEEEGRRPTHINCIIYAPFNAKLILIRQRVIQLEKSNENPKAVPKEEVRNF